MSACPHAEKLIDHLYGELPEAEEARFQRHLEGCADCQEEVGRHRRLRSALRGLLAAAPEGVLERITSRVLAELSPPTGE